MFGCWTFLVSDLPQTLSPSSDPAALIMDPYLDTDDDGSDADVGNFIEGKEAYDFTNVNLAYGVDPTVPLSYVITKLIKAAPRHWKNKTTATCVLSMCFFFFRSESYLR